MTYPKAIVISAALIAAAIAFAAYQPAQSAFGGAGQYALSTTTGLGFAYIVDNKTGKVIYCTPRRCWTLENVGNAVNR